MSESDKSLSVPVIMIALLMRVDRKMKSRLITVLIALVVALAAAGGSYWQINFNKDWREQYAYTKGVDALIYAYPY